jgi:hypothetical protein
MTHSIDSFITDSANSATALYSGHKSTVNALGVYADTSADPFDDPKFESIVEMFVRLTGGKTGIVSTAFIADATPAAFTIPGPSGLATMLSSVVSINILGAAVIKALTHPRWC